MDNWLLFEGANPLRAVLLFLLVAAPDIAVAGDVASMDSECFWEHRNKVNISGSNVPDTIVAEWIRTDGNCAENRKYDKYHGTIRIRIIRADGIILGEHGAGFESEALFQHEQRGTMDVLKGFFKKSTHPHFGPVPTIGEDIYKHYFLKMSEEKYEELLKKKTITFTLHDVSNETQWVYYYDKEEDKLIKVMTTSW